jgi:hypothetical protein
MSQGQGWQIAAKMRLPVAIGRLYRGELVWELGLGGVVVYPRRYRGLLPVTFVSMSEAMGYIDAESLGSGGARIIDTVYEGRHTHANNGQ